MLIAKTPARFVLNGQEQFAPAGSVIIYRKGTPQLYGAAGTEFINDWLHFEADEDDVKTLEHMGIPFDKILPRMDITLLSQLIRNICSEKYSVNSYREETVELYCKLVFIKVAEQLGRSAASGLNRYYSRMSQLRSEIYSMPQQEWTIEAMAEKMSLSRSYFQHLYKKMFDSGAIEDVIRSRVEYGKYLLFSTDYPVSAVAELCGYKNDVHFMRQFKSVVGINPSEYRSQTRISQEEVERSHKRNPFCL